LISYETHEALIELLEWFRAKDSEDMELMNTEEILEEFIEEINP